MKRIEQRQTNKNFVLVAGLFFSLVFSVFAGQPYVEDIRFISDDGQEIEINDNTLSSLKSQVGERLETKNLILDVNTLKESLLQYQNIITAINPIQGDEEAIEVVFQFQLKRTVQSIRILSERDIKIPLDLRKKLRLQRHSFFDSANLERDKNTIAEHYIKKGYPKVAVEHESLLSRNGEDVDLTYRIIPNSARLVVRRLKFKGNDTFERLDLKRLIKSKPRGFFLARHTVFSLYQLEKDAQALAAFYQEEGFLDAQVQYDYRYELDGFTRVTFHIEEGRRYKVDQVRIEHNGLYEAKEIKKLVKIKKGQFYNDKDLRGYLQNIREFLGNRGHAKAQALAHYAPETNTILVKIIEGPSFDIEEIVIEGNQRMKSETILLDVKLERGQRFNADKVKETITKMGETGYYNDVRVDFEPTSESSGKLILIVEEARTQTVSFGVGTGTDGIMGELSFTDRNLFNSGNSLSLHLQKMAEMTKIGLVYRDPHLFDSDYEMRLSSHFRDDTSGAFDERRIGVSLMVEKKITENLKLGVGTRIEFLNLSDIDEEIRLADHNADGKDRIFGMVGTLFYKTQTTDAAGDVKDGVKVSMALLPSFADQGAYLKAFSSVMATQSLWENENGVAHTITGRLTVGYATDDAPFHEKFYAGGVGTLRGFTRNSIGSEEGDGGQILVSASTGYSFPIWEDKVKGVLFVEAASVGDNLDDLGNIRAVGGIGVKANLMNTFLGSMIEAGVAIPLRKEDGDEVKPFYFIFGDYDPAYDL